MLRGKDETKDKALWKSERGARGPMARSQCVYGFWRTYYGYLAGLTFRISLLYLLSGAPAPLLGLNRTFQNQHDHPYSPAPLCDS